ncbi:hypothetical protein F4803DRAFT_327798 [Xylaria telfairii]|nr:hypothetical protein F4803DRAFT_327798 [Xylaria telfairii]
MSPPSTPKKQAGPIILGQLPTPPLTATAREETTSVVAHQHHESGPPVRRLTYEARATLEAANQDESSDLSLCDNNVKQHTQVQLCQLRPEQETGTAPPPFEQQHDTNHQAKSEVTAWLDSSADPQQRQKRFHSLLRGLWLSNKEFNEARHPFYDPEEDGSYEFFPDQIWDGHCPYHDDDYDILADPSRSTEVWQPQIGEEGIENEQDLRMVLKARQEHRDRSKALKNRITDVITAQHRAGVKGADIDMLQVFLGPEIESTLSDSDSESEESEIKPEPTPLTITAFPPPGISTLQPTIAAKGIKVFGGQEFGGQEPSSARKQLKRSKKKGRWSNRRRGRRNNNPNGTYKCDSSSESEQPIHKKAKKGGVAAGKAASGDLTWKAQTRAAARHAQHLGTDGTYENDDDDDDKPTGAAFRMD